MVSRKMACVQRKRPPAQSVRPICPPVRPSVQKKEKKERKRKKAIPTVCKILLLFPACRLSLLFTPSILSSSSSSSCNPNKAAEAITIAVAAAVVVAEEAVDGKEVTKWSDRKRRKINRQKEEEDKGRS